MQPQMYSCKSCGTLYYIALFRTALAHIVVVRVQPIDPFYLLLAFGGHSRCCVSSFTSLWDTTRFGGVMFVTSRHAGGPGYWACVLVATGGVASLPKFEFDQVRLRPGSTFSKFQHQVGQLCACAQVGKKRWIFLVEEGSSILTNWLNQWKLTCLPLYCTLIFITNRSLHCLFL